MNSSVVQTFPRASNASNQTRQCRNTSANGVKGEAEIRYQLPDSKIINMFSLWLVQPYQSDDAALGSPLFSICNEFVVQSGARRWYNIVRPQE